MKKTQLFPINIFLLLILLFSSCKKGDKKSEVSTSSENKNNAFKEYVDKLPTVELPIEFNCRVSNGKMRDMEEQVKLTGINYGPILGKLPSSSDKAILLCVSMASPESPQIYCFDTNGKKTSTEIEIYNPSCGGDEKESRSQYLIISKDLSIESHDSTFSIQNGEIYKEVDIRKYKINEEQGEVEVVQ